MVSIGADTCNQDNFFPLGLYKLSQHIENDDVFMLLKHKHRKKENVFG